MHGVLLVDDERLVREGLARKVDWSRYGLRVVGEADGGEAALELARDESVSLVITDIKMPGMDGLELIRRAGRERPDLRFVVLSGYDEFDFAKEAMRHGVRHYLLKPTKGAELDRVLTEVAAELAQSDEDRRVTDEMRERLEQSLPMIREQLFRDLIMGRLYTRREIESYRGLLSLPAGPLTFLLLRVSEEASWQEILMLRWTVERALGPEGVSLSAAVKDHLAIMTPRTEAELAAQLPAIRERFARLCPRPLTVAISGPGPVEEAAGLYATGMEYLRYRFHYGEGAVITARDAVDRPPGAEAGDVEFYKDRTAADVACGSRAEFDEDLRLLLESLRDERLDRGAVCAHVADLLVRVARHDGYRGLECAVEAIRRAEVAPTLAEIGAVVRDCCGPILEANYAQLRSKRALLVDRLKDGVAECLPNPELSLKWLAANLVYANVDYLSKAFKRETGENFNHYVTRLRMDRAASLLRQSPALPVAEIAQAVGYGENAQYFSRVFRVCLGATPSAFRTQGADQERKGAL